jgi:DNA-binding NtrC family response regulator
MLPSESPMKRSIWEMLFRRKPGEPSALNVLKVPPSEVDFTNAPQFHGQGHPSRSPHPTARLDALFTFVDLKDPFASGEIAGEELPGPVLSMMSARSFGLLYLFHTPHTRRHTAATQQEVAQRFPPCRVIVHELPATDPKDFSILLGSLTRIIRDIWVEGIKDVTGEIFVCVSSGTVEMRASWFLLNALGILPATLLQVGTPLEPLYGPANVKEVRLDSENWQVVRQLAMPWQYYLLKQRVTSRAGVSDLKDLEQAVGRQRLAWRRADQSDPTRVAEMLRDLPDCGPTPQQRRVSLAHVPALEDALQEVGLHVGSASLRYSAEQAAVAAESMLPILLTGETGTGKERFAHLIHRLSPRAQNNLVAVNCAAIPETLAESYLFGHMKGAFSGADSDKEGVFESAAQSTLFLDEIAELSLETQAKLLRVIQDGLVQRVGSTRSRYIDVRIVAATNRDLKKEVALGRFRQDLYFRLEVVQIALPALRERRAEIAELALVLLKQINQRRQRPRQLSKAALLRLEQYDWPGNVRQLSNVLERSVLYSSSDILEPDELRIAEDSSHRDSLVSVPEPTPGFSLEKYVEQVRTQLFRLALAKCGNNQAGAAALLGISRQAVNKFVTAQNDNLD